MTNQEAIRILQAGATFSYDEISAEEFCTAYDMAVAALEAQTDGDVISRQAAIDALDKLHYNDREDWCFVIDAIEYLPSAHPEIIRCADCKYWDCGANDITQWSYCKIHSCNIDPTDFCSYAERRQDG